MVVHKAIKTAAANESNERYVKNILELECFRPDNFASRWDLNFHDQQVNCDKSHENFVYSNCIELRF